MPYIPFCPAFQSTLPVGGATARHNGGTCETVISIHAPRGGSDITNQLLYQLSYDFNPRSPWGERPLPKGGKAYGNHFNPRSPWGERLRLFQCQSGLLGFQSTLPVGGATLPFRAYALIANISIHAPRGGSDLRCLVFSSWSLYFNPRSPWGERLPDRKIHSYNELFQSTLPVGGATREDSHSYRQHARFQSTLPVGGATPNQD